MFYAQFLRLQMPKLKKDTDNLTAISALLGSAHVKAARKTLVKLTTVFQTTTTCLIC